MKLARSFPPQEAASVPWAKLLHDVLRGKRRKDSRRGPLPRPPVTRRHRRFTLEAVEPRLLMSADIAYALGAAQPLTLQATHSGSTYTIGLYETGNTNPVYSANLSAATDTTVTINRTDSSSQGDTIDVDLDSFNALDSFFAAQGANNQTLTLQFAHNSQSAANDLVNLDATGATLSYGLSVQSDSQIASSATASVTGDLTLTSQTTGGDSQVNLTDANLTATGTLSLQAMATETATAALPGGPNTATGGASVTIGDTAGNTSTLSASAIDIAAQVTGTLTTANTLLPAILSGSADPTVTIGEATLDATGPGAAGSLTVAATSNVGITTTDTPDASLTDGTVDAAVAVTTFTSGAALNIGDGATLDAAGAASLSAGSTLVDTTTADASGATAGAAVAASIISGDTTASIAGATVDGSSVSLTATTNRTITTTAESSPGGAAANSSGNTSENYLSQYDPATGSGGDNVGVAGAVAVGTDTGNTSAYVSSGTIDAGTGAATVEAQSADVVGVIANGSNTGSSSTGIGVAVAIDVANRNDSAYITGASDITAGSLAVEVLPLDPGTPSSFTVSATSGAGDPSSVGFAGSLALNITQTTNEAYIDQGATVTLTGSPNVTVEAESNVTNSASAEPAQSGGGGSSANVGIGASIALNYNQDTTAAYLGNNAVVTGAGDLTLTAQSTHLMTTDATGGGAGGTAVTPVVAISISDDNAYTTLGTTTNTPLSIGGNFTANSALADNVETTSSGDTNASKTGIGISLALSVVNDSSLSTTYQNLAAASGTAAFLSSAVSGSQSAAKASVAGGQDEDNDNNSDVDSQTSGQEGFANSLVAADGGSGTKGTEGDTAPSASTSDGSVSVAGAIAANIELGSSQAYIGDGLTVTSGGTLSLTSSANIDGHASASGAAVSSGSGTGVGAGVAVNYADATNLAYVGASTLTVGGLDISATQANRPLSFDAASAVSNNTIAVGQSGLVTGDAVVYDAEGGTAIGGLTDGQTYYVNVQSDGTLALYDSQADAVAGGTTGQIALGAGGSGTQSLVDETDSFGASATSGAGGGKIGVAGSVAINLAFTDTEANLGDAGGVPGVTVTGGGAVSLTAGAAVANMASAEPAASTSGGSSVGVGASVAVDYGQNTVLAQVENGASIGGSAGVDPGSLTLGASLSQTMTTAAMNGVSGGGTEVTPVIAVSVADDDVAATLGSGSQITLSGAFGAQASLSDQVTTSATGNTTTGKTGVGISIAVTVVNDGATASISGRSLTAASATFASSVNSTSASSATASVAGGPADDGSGTQSVDSQTSGQEGFVGSEAGSDTSGGTKAKGTEGASAPSASTSSGSVSVAGAVAANVEMASSEAYVGDGSTVTTTGTLSVTSTATVGGTATADGSAVTASSGGTGVGAAVAVNYADATNLAYIGVATLTVGGLSLSATGGGTDAFGASATSGAGGGKIGVAGSVAINLAFTDTEADLGDSSGVPGITVTGGGAVGLQAAATVANTVSAEPASGSTTGGSSVGVGASVSVNYGQNTVLAQVDNSATIGGAGNLTLGASLAQTMTTDATNGASGGGTEVTPVIAVSVADDDVEATLGSGAQITLSGAFSAQASLSDAVETSATGNTAGNTGIGISIAVSVVNDGSVATTARDLSAAGAATFSASTISGSESLATASVAGGPQDDGSGDQQVDQQTSGQENYVNSESGADNTGSKAKGTEGATAPSASTSSGSVSVAGAVAANIELGSAKAYIPDGLTITSGGVLQVSSAANIDGHAIADGSAVTGSSSGTGVGAAVAVNYADATNQAYIGNATTINAGGLTVEATEAARNVAMPMTTLPVVDTTANTIFLGLDSGLTTGEEVTYHANGGTAIGGLSDGTQYYVADMGGGKFSLFNSASDAQNDTNAIALTSTGSGDQNFTTSGVEGTGLLASTINFQPAGTVNVLNLGNDSGLRTGDAVTYDAEGGSAVGGLTSGDTYYVIELGGGLFQLAATRDDAEAGNAIALTSAGNANQILIDQSDSFITEATSGAGGGKIGVAGSVTVNIVTNNTEALVGLSPSDTAPSTASITITGGGDVAVAAAGDESNLSQAAPSAGGGSGSSVGVGASVAVNVVTNTITAEIADGTAWSGTAGTFSVGAAFADSAITHGENGASANSGAGVGIGAAVAVVQDTATADVGTGDAISATGDVSITTTYTGAFETLTDATAAGGNVGVGASVSVAVIIENASAGLARGLTTTGGTLTVASLTTMASMADATASVQGVSSSDSQQDGKNGSTGADGQADHQLNDNPDVTQADGSADTSLPSASGNVSSANSEGSSQSGASSGGGSDGVGVAAAVAVNFVTTTNIASITGGSTVSAAGAVTVEGQSQLAGTAEGVGTSVQLQSESNNIGAGVGVNVVTGKNEAYVDGNSSVTGQGVTVEAVNPVGATDNFVAWGAAAGGGTGDVGVAGSVAVNVVTLTVEAYVGAGSSVHSGGGLTVAAAETLAPQTLAAGAGFSEGTAVGAAISVAVVNVTANSYIDGNADVAGALSIDATINFDTSAIPIPLLPTSDDPSATSVAVAGGASAGDAAIGGAFIVDVFTANASAYIGAGAQINQGGLYTPSSAQTISIDAENDTTITSIGGALGLTTGSAGIGGSLDVEILNKQTYAYIGDATVSAGGAVSLQANATETMLSIVVTAGGAGTAGVAGSISVAVVTSDTSAYLDNNGSLDAGGTVLISATDQFTTTMLAGAVGLGGEAGVGVADTTLVHSDTVLAYVGTSATVIAGGTGLSIGADESENILTIAADAGVSGSAGVAGSAVVNVLTEVTTADIGDGAKVTVNNGGNLVVSAADDSSVISVSGNLAAGGDAGVGAGVDVGTYQKTTTAYIGSGVNATVGGSIIVAANSSEDIISIAAGLAIGGYAGVGVDAGVHVFTLQTRAFIGEDPDGTATVAANISAGGSIAVEANDTTDINEIVGVLGAGAAGFAAGAGVNVMSKDTEAFIGTGATVSAGGAGAGLTVDTGLIDTGLDTSASTFNPNSPGGVGIDSSTSGSAAESGDRSSFESAGQVGIPQLGGLDLTGNGSSSQVSNPALQGIVTTSPDTENGFTGIAVAATNEDNIRSFVVTFGAGAAGVGISAGVDVVTAKTEATIGDGATVTSGGSVLVGASNYFYHLTIDVGVAAGGVGVAPAVGVNVIDYTTNAEIGAASVTATADVVVQAASNENIAMIGAGASVGGATGVGAVVDVLTVNNSTTASIDGSAIVEAGGNVAVYATDNTAVLELAGSVSVGGVAGIGGSVGVIVLDKDTTATIGQDAHVDALGNTSAASGILDGVIDDNGTQFDTTGANGVIVQAESSENILHIVVAGAVGGDAGVAGAVGVSLITSTTDAKIATGAVIDGNQTYEQHANPRQSVYVNAGNDVTIQSYVIGVGVGGLVGLTGAVDVGTLNNNIDAEIDTGASVAARNDVEVNAVGIKNLTGYTISGAGGIVGLGASVSVWSLGTPIQTSYQDNSGDSSNALTGNSGGAADGNAADQSQSGTSLVTGSGGLGAFTSSGSNSNSSQNRVESASQTAGADVNNDGPTQSSILNAENVPALPPGTTAAVQAGASIHADNDIGVTADEAASVTQVLGQVSGGVVGAGAAVDVLSIADNVTASDDGTNYAGRNIAVAAVFNEGVNVTSLGLQAGYIGLGAGVVVITDNSVTQATLGSVTGAQAVTVEASADRSFTALTGQADVGAVGAGATFVEITIGGGATATVDDSASLTNIASLTVSADSTVTVNATTDAISAGIGAFSANFTIVEANPTVAATIGNNTTVSTPGAVSVDASATFAADATTNGVSAGGLAVGVSLSEVTLAPTVTASVGSDAQITAGSLTLSASTPLPTTNAGYSAQATSTGSVGALVGATSTNAITNNNSVIKSFVDSSAVLTIAGATFISAVGTNEQEADSDSNAGGLVAAGIATSQSNSDTDTEAYLGSNVLLTDSGDVTIAATANDDNFALTNAGSGGAIAGDAAVADTTNDSTTTATIGAGSYVDAATVTLGADHIATFNAQITTLAGGVLAGSGAGIDNQISAATTAAVGDNATVTSDDISITATDDAEKPLLNDGSESENDFGTTGGLASAAGAADTTTISFTTKVTIGDYASLDVPGVTSDLPLITLAALNIFNVHDIMAFETGGAVSGAAVTGTITTSTDIADVYVGQGASITSSGAIVMSARGGGTIDQEISTETYGAGTATLGSTTVDIEPDNTVEIGPYATVTANGDLDLSAGSDTNYDTDQYVLTSTYDGFAGSAIPISSIHATGYLIQTDLINIDQGALAESGGTANLYTDLFGDDQVTTQAKAESWVSDLSGSILSALGGGALAQYANTNTLYLANSVITNDGTVETGINRNLSLDLTGWNDATGQITSYTASPGITFQSTYQTIANTLAAEITRDEQLLNEYGANTPLLQQFYQNQINQDEAEIAADNLPTETPGGTPEGTTGYQMAVNVAPIVADAGRIWVVGSELAGSGSFIAPSDASVTITNNTPAFLNIYGITIPADNGGMYFNGDLWTTNSQITTQDQKNIGALNQRNQNAGSPLSGFTASSAGFAAVPNPSTSTPVITIENTLDVTEYNNTHGTQYTWPDITLVSLEDGGVGIDAPTTDVTFATKTATDADSLGNINMNGPVIAANLTVTTGGEYLFDQPSEVFPTGDTPYTAWAGITTGSYDPNNPGQTAPYVAEASAQAVQTLLSQLPNGQQEIFASKIVVIADVIDVDGVIQSGQTDYDLTLPQVQTDNDIAAILHSGATTPQLLVNESNSNFTVYFDPISKQIQISSIKASGGDIELTGQIVNTANGQIIVQGGYADVNIDNQTNYALEVNTLDVSAPGMGTLLIDDTTPRVINGTTYNSYVTLYQVNNGEVTETVGYGDNTTTYAAVSMSDSFTYAPVSNWRYAWTVGVSYEEQLSTTEVQSNWAGIIPTGSSSFTWDTTIALGTPVLEGAGPYYYLGNPADNYVNDPYAFSSQTITESLTTYAPITNTSTSWYGGTTYTVQFEAVAGTVELFNQDISAARPIGIQFIGYDSGGVTINSEGNVVVNGPISNPSGTTSITTQGSILQGGASGSVGGSQVVLSAQDGIGTATVPLQVNVGGTATAGLNAVTASGIINISQAAGTLPVDQVVTQTLGAITLSAEGNIDVAQGGQGLVSGGAISLASTAGGIGGGTAAPLLVNTSDATMQDSLTVTAQTDVYIEDETGNLQVNSITTPGDVWLDVPNGSLINANQTGTVDQRTEQDLIDTVWSELGLTQQTGYAQTVANTIASYVSAMQQEYQTYWQFRHLQTDGGATFDPSLIPNGNYLTAAQTAYYQNYYAGQGLDASQIQTAIQTLNNQDAAEYVALNATFGAGGTYVTENDTSFTPDTYNPSFVYKPTTNETNALAATIPEWSENSLYYPLSAGLLKEVTSTQVVIYNPNIVANNVTLLTEGSVGDNGQSLNIDVSTPPVTFTTQEQVALAAAQRQDVQFLGAEPIAATVDFNAATNQITRVDGGTWSGLAVGDMITVQGSTTQNATNGNLFYEIAAINSSDTVLTLVSTGAAGTTSLVASETNEAVTVAPVVLDPSFQATGATVSADVIFAASTTSGGATITRTDGGNWVTDGFAVGQLLQITGSNLNSTSDGLTYTVAAVTGQVITLSQSDLIQNEGTQTDPIAIQITPGKAPVITNIEVAQIEPLTADMTGKLNITAGESVLLNSNVGDINIGQITAGDTTVGAQIRIEGQGSILDAAGSGVTNLRGNYVLLEAANGAIGSYSVGTDGTVDSNPITLDQVGAGGLSASAQQVINIAEVAGYGSGNLNIESVFSAGGNVYLSAYNSILSAENNTFTKIQAGDISLDAMNGTIGSAGTPADYLDIDASGTVTALAEGNIWISQTAGDLTVSQIQSDSGDVYLQAAFSIVEDPAVGPAPAVFGNNIDLVAVAGGIGAPGASLGIISQAADGKYDAGLGGMLTASSDTLGIYLTQTTGDLLLDTISVTGALGAADSAFIAAPDGNIYNGTGGYNVLSGNVLLFASGNIGTADTHIKTEVGTIEAQSTAGSTWVDNTGGLDIGGSFTSNPDGVVSGGTTNITASSPIEIKKSIDSVGAVNITANDAVTGTLVIDSLDLDNNPIFIKSDDASVTLTADASLTVQAGVSVEAATDITATAATTVTIGGGATFQADGNITVTAGTSLTMDSGGTLNAGGAIGVTTLQGDMVLGLLESGLSNGTAVTLASAGNIFGNGDPLNVELLGSGAAAALNANNGNGNIGTSLLPLAVSMGASDTLSGVAAAAYFDSPTGLQITTLSTTGELSVNAALNLAVETLSSTDGNIDLQSGGAFTTGTGGQVTSGGAITINSASIVMGAGSDIIGGGEVSLTTTQGNIVLGAVESSFGPGLAINLDAAGSVLGNGDGQPYNIMLTGTGADVNILAGTGIGSSTLAVSVDPGTLTATATTGDIWLYVADGIDAASVVADTGSVNLFGANNLTFGTIDAAQNVLVDAAGDLTGTTIDATNGNVTIDAGGNATLTTVDAGNAITVNVGGTLYLVSTDSASASLTAGGTISFGNMVATGAVSLTSHHGDILGENLTAGGNVSVSGVGVSLTSVTAGGTTAIDATGPTSATDAVAGEVSIADYVSATGTVTIAAYDSIAIPSVTSTAGSIGLTATNGNIAIPTLAAAGDITSTAAGTTTLDTATSGGSMSFTSGGEILFTTLTAGGSIAVVSGTADVLGVTATAGGNADFAGDGVAMMTLTAGGTVSLTSDGPLSLADPYAGEIIINSVTAGGTVTADSAFSIFVPSIMSTGGGISLTAGQDIEVPTLAAATTAAGSITTEAGGVTNIVAATGGGDLSLSGTGTITFRLLAAGGNLAVTSADGFVLGVPDAQIEAYDGSVFAGGNASISGVGVAFTDLAAGGNVSVTSAGIVPPTRSDPNYNGPNLYATEPYLWPALGNLYYLQLGLTHQQPVNMPAVLYGLSYTLYDMTHAQYVVTVAPTNLGNLVTTLEDDVAGLLTVPVPPNVPPPHWQGLPAGSYTVTYPPCPPVPGHPPGPPPYFFGAGPWYGPGPGPGPWTGPGPWPGPGPWLGPWPGPGPWPAPGQWSDVFGEGGIAFNNIMAGGSVTVSSGDAIDGNGIYARTEITLTTDTLAASTPGNRLNPFERDLDVDVDYTNAPEIAMNGQVVFIDHRGQPPGPVPTISWAVSDRQTDSVSDNGSPDWVGDFVNYLAQDALQRNPNLCIRVQI